MSNDVIFYTQIFSIVGFILTLFAVYKLLIQQKDSVIELLREQLKVKSELITELKTTTPDSLSKALNERVAIFEAEIYRLKLDEANHILEIKEKEATVNKVRELLLELAGTIENEGLACPDCGSPLSVRYLQPLYRQVDGIEHEVGHVEYEEYECGYKTEDQVEKSACGAK